MNTLQKSALAAVCAGLMTGSAYAQFECYDFSGLASDSKYTVGDVINARHATITIKQYFWGGAPTTAEARNAQVRNSKIAGGAAPEMYLYLVSVNVVPNSPVTRVRTRLAQSIGGTGQYSNANIEVNGERHESSSGFAAMNGRTIGQASKGRASITSSMAPYGNGNWNNGTLELRATQGAIESFTLGGHTWSIDDMCFAK
jgi:hypothetical protein